MTEEQKKRVHEIVYSCDSRTELAERMVRLEELATNMLALLREIVELHPNVLLINNIPAWQAVWREDPVYAFARKMHELGIETNYD